MIQYLTREKLNIEKYDDCISNALNTRIYAFSWYLDIVADDWGILVKDDYEAVMPLPKKRKYFIPYIYLAPWTQQLGIFSSNYIDKTVVFSFIESIPKKFKLIDVFLNSNNTVNLQKIKLRDNFVLSLDKTYDQLKSHYGKGRKSSCKQAKLFNLNIIENYDHVKIIELFKANKGGELNRANKDYDILNDLMKYAIQYNFVQIFGVINSNKELIGGAFFLKDKHRISYLFSAINNEGREKQAMSLLMDHVIKTYAASNYILDFEGSMIKELASFFKSFGAQKEIYFHFKKYRL